MLVVGFEHVLKRYDWLVERQHFVGGHAQSCSETCIVRTAEIRAVEVRALMTVVVVTIVCGVWKTG